MELQRTLTSNEVAEMIGTTNGELMKTIRTYIKYLGEGNIPSSDFFISSTYQSEQNKPLPNYLLTKQGCEMVSNKLTGAKGVQFTAKYVSRFNQMENHIKTTENLVTPEDIMIATLQNIKNVKAEVKTVQADIVELKQEIDLTRKQKSELRKLVLANVMKAVGGKKSHAYESLYRVAIAEHWRTIKNYFEVSSYEEIPKLRFDEALELAECWQPSAELALEIKRANQVLMLA